jgi:hypothetical protein
MRIRRQKTYKIVPLIFVLEVPSLLKHLYTKRGTSILGGIIVQRSTFGWKGTYEIVP